MGTKKIAIVGKMHSGKTTLAESFVNRGFTRFAFADPVKDVAAAMLTTFMQEMRGYETKIDNFSYDDMNKMKGHPSIRALLQLVGTELGRNWYGPDDIWIQKFKERIKQAEHQAGMLRWEYSIVNDDCRFPNEAVALKELGFTIIRLERDEAERQVSIRDALMKANPDLSLYEIEKQMAAMGNHPSETNVDLIDADIDVPSISVVQLYEVAALFANGDPKEISDAKLRADLGVFI